MDAYSAMAWFASVLIMLMLTSSVLVVWVAGVAAPEEWDGNEYDALGFILSSPRALDDLAEVIGCYQGAAIYRKVIFRGRRYEFAHVATPKFKSTLFERELYLEPGLVYVAV